MSAENPQKETPLEKPSLKETLAAKRREAEESAALLASEAAEKEAEELKAREEQESGELKQQITELDEKKKRLEDLITKIKDAYKGVDEAVGNFKEADKEIKKMMKEYKDVLASPLEENQDPINTKKRKKPDAEGGGEEPHHDFRDELIGSEQADNFQETAGFKEKQQTLNEKIAAVLAEKEKIKKELPDADLSVGSSKKEGKDNEDAIVAKMQEAIAKLQKEIADLVDQTPEKKAERKKIAECASRLENDNPYGRIPFKGEPGHGLTKEMLIKSSLFIRDSRVPQYVQQFGEDAYKQAAFDLLLPKFITAMREQKTGELSADDKAKLEEMLKSKIDRDVVDQLLEDDERQNSSNGSERDLERITSEAKNAEKFIAHVEAARQNFAKKLGKKIKVDDTRAFGPKGAVCMVKELNPVTDPTRRIMDARDENGSKIEKLRKERDGIKKPLMFGKAEYESKMIVLGQKLDMFDRERVEIARELESAEARDKYATVEIKDLTWLYSNSGVIMDELLKSKKIKYDGFTIEEFLNEMENILKAKAQNKPSPELVAKATRHSELKNKLSDRDSAYRGTIQNVWHI